jgi:GrpB-like predicted nucleotidyltransferase (UPF0157 family)
VIVVVEYDPAWPQRFEQLRREYAEAMASARVPVAAIEHVGSTSVPGLAAKPIIDCDIVVARQDVAAASQALTALRPADPRLRQEYAAVKRRAGATAANIDDYGRAKNAMVQRILAAGGLTDAERASINANQVPSHDEFPR